MLLADFAKNKKMKNHGLTRFAFSTFLTFCFLDSKVKKSKNHDFSKGVIIIVHGFGKKFDIFPCFYFWQNQPAKCV